MQSFSDAIPVCIVTIIPAVLIFYSVVSDVSQTLSNLLIHSLSK